MRLLVVLLWILSCQAADDSGSCPVSQFGCIPSHSPKARYVERVTRAQYSADAASLKRHVGKASSTTMGIPLVLEGAVEYLKSLKKQPDWSLKHIMDQAPVISGARQSNLSSLFLYQDDSATGQELWGTTAWAAKAGESRGAKVQGKQTMESIADSLASGAPFTYAVLALSRMQKDRTCGSLFHEAKTLLKPVVTDPACLADGAYNVWLGQENITAQGHYDTTLNHFAQLSGHKRFHLFPPSEIDRFCQFPPRHPSARQLQADFPSLLRDLTPHNTVVAPNVSCPSANLDDLIIADIGPGDILIMPGFWIHHVHTYTSGIGINLWCKTPSPLDSKEVESTLGMLTKYTVQTELSSGASTKRVVRLVRTLTLLAVQAAEAEGGFEAALENSFRTSYGALLEHPPGLDPSSTEFCSKKAINEKPSDAVAGAWKDGLGMIKEHWSKVPLAMRPVHMFALVDQQAGALVAKEFLKNFQDGVRFVLSLWRCKPQKKGKNRKSEL